MKSRAFMILGTSSDAGKSLIAAAFCRLFSDWGYSTAPFKAQNMSNNSFVTSDGGEIGRAQAVQAECARVEASVDMNPILLKPSGDNQSQLVLHGRAAGNFSARQYYSQSEKMEKAVRESYEKLAGKHEVIVLEGAGSAAEVNLKQYDLVNMKAAEMADARCLLAADIERGGVFASVIGTLGLLEPHERARVDGILINKFRGDQTLFEEGVQFIEARTGIKVWGVLPYSRDFCIDEEDGLNLKTSGPVMPEELDIAVLRLPHISNFTDFGILAQEPGVRVRYVEKAEALSRPDLLILPGTKATAADYEFLCARNFPQAIQRYVKEGGRVLGICGGFQMMGRKIRDTAGVESTQKETDGLGFFDMTTEFQPEKILRQTRETLSLSLFGGAVRGEVEAYEIHMGTSVFHQSYASLGPGGAVSACGKFAGTYYHGLFDQPGFRKTFLEALASDCGKKRTQGLELSARDFKEKQYTALVRWLSSSIRMDLLKQAWQMEPRSTVAL